MSVERSKFSSRLSLAEVAEIRSAPLPTKHADLARKFGVSATTIARIRRGLTWPEERPTEVRVLVPAAAVAGLEMAALRAGTTPSELLARAAVRAADGCGATEPGTGRAGPLINGQPERR